ncbi:MAG: hypothetical protein ABIP94_09395 [Planctomycetota bacterium]
MKCHNRIVTCLALLASTSLLNAATLQQKPAAATKPAIPCVLVQQVNTESPTSYAMWIAEVNKAIKAKFGFDNYLHVYLGEVAGPDSGVAFAVSRADSFAALAANSKAFEKEISLVDARLHMSEIRKLGPQIAYKAVRFDGVNPGAFVLNTKAVLSDEAAYLKALDGLRTLFDSHDFKDCKINCYRIASGRTDFSHMISLNCPSTERRAMLMDAINDEAWAQEWIANAGKYRTVVSNGSYHDITPLAN